MPELITSNLPSQVFLPCCLQKIPEIESERQRAWEVGGRVKEAEGREEGKEINYSLQMAQLCKSFLAVTP